MPLQNCTIHNSKYSVLGTALNYEDIWEPWFNPELFSFSNPDQLNDHTALKMSCLTKDLVVIKPYAVTGDTPGMK